VRQPDWKAACHTWERRALEYKRQIRELEKVIADLKRERSEWRRLASNKDEESRDGT
jgi:hypothetical protein